MKNERKKGGRRFGAGRPRGRLKITLSVRVTPEAKFMLDVMPGCNSSLVEQAIWREYCDFVSNYLLRNDKDENLAEAFVKELNDYKESLP